MRNGVRPPSHIKAGGKIIREVIKQLKTAKHIENYAVSNNVTMGMYLTPKGKTELDKISSGLRRDIQ